MNWELIFVISSASVLSFFSFLFGFFVATKFSVYTKISKKEDYEAKVAELDRMMDEFNNRVNETEETTEEPNKKIRPFELFPEDLNRDFGLPRELR